MERRFRNEKIDAYAVARPPYRRLRIFSRDPGLRVRVETAVINESTVEIPWEAWPGAPERDGPAPGPVGEYLEVVDYDPASQAWYRPIDLNDPYLLAQDGLAPSDGNPQFHQQMVYAVAMRTIKNFEVALGRRALWDPRRFKSNGRWKEDYVPRLRIYPHALREPNAYYSPDKKALLFGYFPAAPGDSGDHVPGAMVFTCLSHDVIAHETTHALLDGMHRRLTEDTNPDVLAFHEAFADIVALFQHFSYREVLEHEIARTAGRLEVGTALGELAQEFGIATGRGGALRSAIGAVTSRRLVEEIRETHERGSILVAAVFDAFLSIYRRRTEDLVRLATQGTGVLPKGAIHPDLVARLAEEAAKSAKHVLTICIRALDYLPPVDVSFGDYLRALITADFDLVPDDARQYRVAFMEAFRHRGIFPRDARTLSEESLRWQEASRIVMQDDPRLDLGSRLEVQMQNWDLSADREETYRALHGLRGQIHGIFEESRSYKSGVTRGVDFTRGEFEVHAVRPVRRSGPHGEFLMDAVVEITQRIPGYFDKTFDECRKLSGEEDPDFWFRGGSTLILDLTSRKLRYCIYKDINDADRFERTKRHILGEHGDASLHATYFSETRPSEAGEVFSFLHRHQTEGGA